MPLSQAQASITSDTKHVISNIDHMLCLFLFQYQIEEKIDRNNERKIEISSLLLSCEIEKWVREEKLQVEMEEERQED